MDLFSKLFGKRKKYPHNKKGPPAAVYAGPEYFANRNRPKNPGGKIYAGPEYFGQKREDEVLDVYAGPEYFGGPAEEPEDDLSDTVCGGPPLVTEEEDAPPAPDDDAARQAYLRLLEELTARVEKLHETEESFAMLRFLQNLRGAPMNSEEAKAQLAKLQERLTKAEEEEASLYTAAVYAGPEQFKTKDLPL